MEFCRQVERIHPNPGSSTSVRIETLRVVFEAAGIDCSVLLIEQLEPPFSHRTEASSLPFYSLLLAISPFAPRASRRQGTGRYSREGEWGFIPSEWARGFCPRGRSEAVSVPAKLKSNSMSFSAVFPRRFPRWLMGVKNSAASRRAGVIGEKCRGIPPQEDMILSTMSFPTSGGGRP